MTGERAAPPTRRLLVVTLLVVAVFTVWRLAMAAALDLRSDEAYYWTWSHQAVLSFLDQPPMVAWFERFGELVFGDTPLGARFAQILSLPLIELLLADIARRRTQSWNAALFLILALECAANYAAFVVVVEPSIPLLLFTSLILWTLCRLDETMDGRWWLLIGVAGGLALLSKYIVLLLAPALLLFLLLTPRHRRWLTTPWPWAAVIIAAALFSPVLIWNAQHNWVSFAFQGVRLGQGHPLGTSDLVRFGLYEALFAGPILVIAAIVGSLRLGVRSIRLRQPFGAAVAVAFVFTLGFFAIRSLTFQINQSWAYFMWPIGVLALVLSIRWDARPLSRNLLLAGIAATGLPLVVALLFHATPDTGVWFGTGDPYGQDAGYGETADKVLADAKSSGATWIATSDYRTYANLLFHIGDKIPVLQINERSRFLDFAPRDPAQFQGKALYVHYGAPTPILTGAVVTPVETLPIVWHGEPMQTVSVDSLEGFAPELNPAPGSPAYAWSN